MLSEHSGRQLAAFGKAIAAWRIEYRYAWCTYIAKKEKDGLRILAARVFLSLFPKSKLNAVFEAGEIQAGQFIIDQSLTSVEHILEQVMSPSGFVVSDHGTILLPYDEIDKPDLTLPVLLHPEGLSDGSRLAVLTASSVHLSTLISQPDSDWLLKAAERPYDSFAELCADYSLSGALRERATFEVVAPVIAQVSARSQICGETATIGIWTTSTVTKERIRLNFRVVGKERVLDRRSIAGVELTWEDSGNNEVHGLIKITVPPGSLVHCIACYGGHAQHQRYLSDPNIHQNPRHASLSIADPGLHLLRSYLLPELPVKGRAADDFESAVTWMLWALGFAPINFGLHPKTRDAFDVIAVSPRGDYVVIECTVGLLKAESKLSKLGARAAQVRMALDRAEMSHLKVVPLIVTALTRDEVSVDLPAANDLGVTVLTRENLELSFDEVLKFPDAESLLARLLETLKI